ncbi:hypothetical protein F5Y06DRAFT_272458 [Hypoxylon sp. FL0890]|nr:hypothetical protein F5Y06DRAFT_272458 [Hypoxylon sp. FL0890]
MSGSNPFSTPLDQSNLTAKLAVLQPAADQNAPIELTLTEARLKDTSYECISYDRSSKTAAAADNTTNVLVDGEEQAIPKQFESALRTFRRKERPRTFWADVLVGRTVEERSAQANVQRHVLENAERTLCWLGPDKGESTAKAFETIHEMGRRFTEACRQVGFGPDEKLSSATVQQMMGLREHLLNCPYNDLNSFDFAAWREIYKVFGAPYWKSVQCISEIVLARAPIIVCGRSNIRWHQYIASSRAMPLYQAKFFKVPLLPHVFKGFEIANEIEIAERRRRLGQSIALLPMIQTARECEPADPRENVFSMLHIATPSGRAEFHKQGPQPLPTIDYAKTPQQVFADAARYIILERQDLMLWYSERPPCARRLKGLPSWVPDFGAIAPKTGALFNPGGGMRRWWDEIRPLSARKPITISEDNAIHLQARPLDRIVHVSPIFNAGNARRLCFSEFKKMLDHTSISPSISTSPSTSTPTTSSAHANEPSDRKAERFWRALILDVGGTRSASDSFRDTAPPPSSLGAHFQSLVAEEGILKALDCTMDDLQTPENAARLRASPALMDLVAMCETTAEPYEALLVNHAVGRRFFRTEGGRFGMSAVEDVVAADNSLASEERRQGDESGEAAGSDGSQVTAEEARRADMGRLMNDPVGRSMMESFQQYLNQRDPNMARLAARAMRGEIPGLSEDELVRTDGGVREGDLVVACVGGFFPYVLRPRPRRAEAEETRGETEESNSQPAGEHEEDSATYEYVGECYLHGAMDGEDFQTSGVFGRKFFRVDTSKLVDIRYDCMKNSDVYEKI